MLVWKKQKLEQYRLRLHLKPTSGRPSIVSINGSAIPPGGVASRRDRPISRMISPLIISLPGSATAEAQQAASGEIVQSHSEGDPEGVRKASDSVSNSEGRVSGISDSPKLDGIARRASLQPYLRHRVSGSPGSSSPSLGSPFLIRRLSSAKATASNPQIAEMSRPPAVASVALVSRTLSSPSLASNDDGASLDNMSGSSSPARKVSKKQMAVLKHQKSNLNNSTDVHSPMSRSSSASSFGAGESPSPRNSWWQGREAKKPTTSTGSLPKDKPESPKPPRKKKMVMSFFKSIFHPGTSTDSTDSLNSQPSITQSMSSLSTTSSIPAITKHVYDNPSSEKSIKASSMASLSTTNSIGSSSFLSPGGESTIPDRLSVAQTSSLERISVNQTRVSRTHGGNRDAKKPTDIIPPPETILCRICEDHIPSTQIDHHVTICTVSQEHQIRQYNIDQMLRKAIRLMESKRPNVGRADAFEEWADMNHFAKVVDSIVAKAKGVLEVGEEKGRKGCVVMEKVVNKLQKYVGLDVLKPTNRAEVASLARKILRLVNIINLDAF
ncbi:hypothetical protein BC829DRAFT_98627 [Chytridium lagenaria]|nr:hypothetical protein BC829DRAFT_98627 [Chytridium lagenaria]